MPPSFQDFEINTFTFLNIGTYLPTHILPRRSVLTRLFYGTFSFRRFDTYLLCWIGDDRYLIPTYIEVVNTYTRRTMLTLAKVSKKLVDIIIFYIF